jgi:Na+-driven multidrug efflux pump
MTAEAGFLWWMAGLSIAIGVGALFGSSKPSATQNHGFSAVIVTLMAYGLVRIPIRFLTAKTINVGHELEILLYCASLAVALCAARWLTRRGCTKTEVT